MTGAVVELSFRRSRRHAWEPANISGHPSAIYPRLYDYEKQIAADHQINPATIELRLAQRKTGRVVAALTRDGLLYGAAARVAVGGAS